MSPSSFQSNSYHFGAENHVGQRYVSTDVAMQETSEERSSYIFDAENPADLVRLSEQNRLFMATMGDPLAGLPELSALSKVLDVACGPGDWVIDIAFRHRRVEVAGIDFHPGAISYAIAKARSQHLSNVSFGVMNWLEPLDFSDNTFDIINGTFLGASMPRSNWPSVLQEFLRILRPGGVLRLIESDRILTNAQSCERLTDLFLHTLHQAGYGLSPDGVTMGFADTLEPLLQAVGFRQLQRTLYTLNFSADTPDWQAVYRNIDIAALSLYSLTSQLEGIALTELEELHNRGRMEMMAEDFCGVWPFFSICGVKA